MLRLQEMPNTFVACMQKMETNGRNCYSVLQFLRQKALALEEEPGCGSFSPQNDLYFASCFILKLQKQTNKKLMV